MERHAIGEVVDIENPAEVAQSIERLAKSAGLRLQYAAAGRQLGAGHTPENFSRVICDAIGGSAT